jgi:hypothetical protein
MKKFLGINALVTVELTQKGIDCLTNNEKIFFKIQPNQKKKTITTELWDIMRMFGPHLYMGQTALFKENYLLINEDELV